MWIPTSTGFSGESETVDLFKLPITTATTRCHMPYLPKTQPTMTKTKKQENYNMCTTRSLLWTCYENSINYNRYRPFEYMKAERKCQFRSTWYAFSLLHKYPWSQFEKAFNNRSWHLDQPATLKVHRLGKQFPQKFRPGYMLPHKIAWKMNCTASVKEK